MRKRNDFNNNVFDILDTIPSKTVFLESKNKFFKNEKKQKSIITITGDNINSCIEIAHLLNYFWREAKDEKNKKVINSMQSIIINEINKYLKNFNLEYKYKKNILKNAMNNKKLESIKSKLGFISIGIIPKNSSQELKEVLGLI